MAQTPCKLIYGGDDTIDHTFAADATAGDVLMVQKTPFVVVRDVDYLTNPLGTLYNEGVFDVPKKQEAFSEGYVVYWHPAGNPYGGTAGSGAASHSSGAGSENMGVCIKDAGSTDTYVRIALLGTNRLGT